MSFFLVLLNINLLAQQEMDNGSKLIDALKSVEAQTGLVFNYDPAILSAYLFEGQLNFNNHQLLLENIFL